MIDYDINKGNTVSQDQLKPYQWLAWIATALLVVAALLSSIVPEWHWHHVPFIIANTLWTITGLLWKERSLIVLNVSMVLIYVVGLIVG